MPPAGTLAAVAFTSAALGMSDIRRRGSLERLDSAIVILIDLRTCLIVDLAAMTLWQF